MRRNVLFGMDLVFTAAFVFVFVKNSLYGYVIVLTLFVIYSHLRRYFE